MTAEESRVLATVRDLRSQETGLSADERKGRRGASGTQPLKRPYNGGEYPPLAPVQEASQGGTKASAASAITAGPDAVNESAFTKGRVDTIDYGNVARQPSNNPTPSASPQLQGGQTSDVRQGRAVAANEPLGQTHDAGHGRAPAANEAHAVPSEHSAKTASPAVAREAPVSKTRAGVAGVIAGGVSGVATGLAHGESLSEATAKTVESLAPLSRAMKLAMKGKIEEAIVSGAGDIGMYSGAAVGGIIGGAAGSAVVVAPGVATAAGIVGGGALGASFGKEAWESAAKGMIGLVHGAKEIIEDAMKIKPAQAPVSQDASPDVNPRMRR